MAGVAKLLDQPGSRRALSDFGVRTGSCRSPRCSCRWWSSRWRSLSYRRLCPRRGGGGAGAAARLHRRDRARGRTGRPPDCHCSARSTRPRPVADARSQRRAGGARGGRRRARPGPSIPDWVSARTAAELVAVAAGAAAIALAALALRLWVDRRDLRRDLAAARAELAALPPGLPVGAQAPGFTLAELEGETRTLESLRARGRPVMLVFVSPGCGPCRRVFREVDRWQGALSDRLTVAVISSGTAAENLPIAREHGISGMLLQEDVEVMRAYRVRQTPSALLVTPGGAIASTPVEGALPIEPLIRLTLQRLSTSSPPRQVAARAT